jgi:acyl-CoA reductase-like NAD-dependent aldehyde dehydrogenase
MNQAHVPSSQLGFGADRRAQRAWAHRPVAARLAVLRRFRQALAMQPAHLTEALVEHRGIHELEALASEVLPLADACAWLEDHASRVLATRPARGSAPLWMAGGRVEIVREPIGLVLIIAPGNYPLFLAGVQALQALAAGNAVLLKPAPGTTTLMTRFRDALLVAGLPLDVLTLLPEDPAVVREVLADVNGPEMVIVTGSARTGRSIQQLIADGGRPVGLISELSGADVSLILPDANLESVARALRFAANLNRGRTCIAPRLILVPADREAEFTGHLQRTFAHLASSPYSAEESRKFAQVLSLALELGAELVPVDHSPVAVLRGLPLDAAFPWDDLFSPLLFIAPYRSIEEALAFQRRLPQGLGASIFGPEKMARKAALEMEVGCVTINDVVATTADPRLPFSARRASGFGVTRGEDGLLALTVPKAVAIQCAPVKPHWQETQPGDERILKSLLAFQHAPLTKRFAAARDLLRAVLERKKEKTG